MPARAPGPQQGLDGAATWARKGAPPRPRQGAPTHTGPALVAEWVRGSRLLLYLFSHLPPTDASPPGSVWELGTPPYPGNSRAGGVGDRSVAKVVVSAEPWTPGVRTVAWASCLGGRVGVCLGLE